MPAHRFIRSGPGDVLQLDGLRALLGALRTCRIAGDAYARGYAQACITFQEGYRKLNSKKYRPMAARKESRNVLSGRR
jgi:hypothetical protein